jgi:hypothetical protein
MEAKTNWHICPVQSAILLICKVGEKPHAEEARGLSLATHHPLFRFSFPKIVSNLRVLKILPVTPLE